MTEDEAKTKWCPFAMVPSAIESRSLSYNRSIGNKPIPKATTCIGSECMAWRTSHTTDSAGGKIVMTCKDGHGFCGLAGKP